MLVTRRLIRLIYSAPGAACWLGYTCRSVVRIAAWQLKGCWLDPRYRRCPTLPWWPCGRTPNPHVCMCTKLLQEQALNENQLKKIVIQRYGSCGYTPFCSVSHRRFCSVGDHFGSGTILDIILISNSASSLFPVSVCVTFTMAV